MNFTKTLLAVALLASAGAANASAFTPGDAVLTVIDFTNSSLYSVDLGVTTAALQANPSLTFTTDAAFATFVAGEAAGDSILWNVDGAYTTKVGTKTYSDALSTFTATSVSDFATLLPNSATGVTNITNLQGAITTIQNSLLSGATGGQTVSAVWSPNASNNEGTLVNDAAVGTSLNVWQVARTGSSTVAETLLTTANFTVSGTTGTLVIGSTSGGTTSAVPLPTSVWMFLSGIVGLLSMKRRSSAAA